MTLNNCSSIWHEIYCCFNYPQTNAVLKSGTMDGTLWIQSVHCSLRLLLRLGVIGVSSCKDR